MEVNLEQFRTQWQEKKGNTWSFLCPHCRASRRVAHRPAPTFRHYVQLTLTTAVFAVATSPQFGWKGFVAFIPFTIIFELVFRSRARAALDCPHCGFDPYLYLVDTKRARQEIESHWKKKFAEKGIPYPGSHDPETTQEISPGPPEAP